MYAFILNEANYITTNWLQLFDKKLICLNKTYDSEKNRKTATQKH